MAACGWKIEGPRMRPQNEVHVYAYLGGRMIGMLDCQLCGSGVQLRMVYVSPPWRGSSVLRDMLATLKGHYRKIVVLHPQRR